MNHKFDKLAKALAESVTRRLAPKELHIGVAALALACFGPANGALAQPGPPAGSCIVTDPAGDAVFPTDLYGAPVPAYLDIIEASVTLLNNGMFHFEVEMNAEIPENPSPDFNVSVNHLGITVGILTDLSTAGTPFKFLGQTDVYHFNFLVGALYSFSDSGIGLNLGWSGFLLDTSTGAAVVIPMQLRGDTLVFETSADSLGNPTSFQWGVATECDPVPIPDEKRQTTLLEDFAPDHGTATWPCARL